MKFRGRLLGEKKALRIRNPRSYANSTAQHFLVESLGNVGVQVLSHTLEVAENNNAIGLREIQCECNTEGRDPMIVPETA